MIPIPDKVINPLKTTYLNTDAPPANILGAADALSSPFRGFSSRRFPWMTRRSGAAAAGKKCLSQQTWAGTDGLMSSNLKNIDVS